MKRHKETLAVFEAERELKKQVDARITAGIYSKAAAQWARGLIID